MDNAFLASEVASEVDASAGSVSNAPAKPQPAPGVEVVWEDAKRVRDNPFQPRIRIPVSRLQSLKKSFDEQGQLQAALGRRNGRVIELAIGHRRKATVLFGGNGGSQMPDADAYRGKLRIELRPLTDQQMLDAAWDENEEREDISVFDEANYYQKLRALAPGPVGEEVSWEDLALIRARLGKPLKLKPRSIRRIVEVLRLPDEVQDRLAEINLAQQSETGEDEEKFVGVKEKHCRALLLFQPAGEKPARATAEQLALLAEIEKQRLSGNETVRRAEKKRGADPAKPKSSKSQSGTGDGAAVSNQTENAPSSTPSPAPTSPATGVPAIQGIGMVVAASSAGAKTEPKTERQDIATMLLQPATEMVATATKLWPELRMSDEARADYRARVETAAGELEHQLSELKITLSREGK